ncbi:hypothetical protein [Amycolatopsis magusensis]|uniref:Uncharacterized protein n=1 Tax=Amycolatopsis magusensis TaxID=882444 RepID=A0ABS4PW51_9PSEU|nr:hypothetical protein [Amycolatopsis magusensis]MBP2183640.1 hypothetical protein [Amycolatopsis magusensis]MDI5976762.1 hypothetical protein [Amycolatopsis magusensis]
MSIDTARSEDVVSKVVRELAGEFATVPPSGIVGTVVAAKRDLDGQIVPEAMEEMLHRLAQFRLTRWDVAGRAKW